MFGVLIPSRLGIGNIIFLCSLSTLF
jgi:hypothetical protein